ncbi:TetR/AcrR family transcriptional regulator [Ktedonospora formicarum]|uniref:HTH tetR-type domain-containing protein n=1 Tax=Ktedonospora formicarum TaxID=2778364 RepID=A0A8J3IAI2_9CHLR|nr:TetR/AcrR family transcriptional regulator [Ktedonospora formicarum]GHO50431.1 hypothetical protein KSX_85940 [Ktedonospora formicarum]
MPRTTTANHEIREARRAKLLDAARKVFVRQGRAMTIADIAAEANVSQGLAYRYFTNKEAIFHALIEQVIEASPAELHHFLQMQGTPGERLALLVSQLFEGRRTYPEFFHLLDQGQIIETMPNDLRERVRDQGRALLELLRQLIVEAQQAGEVAQGDPDQLVIALTAYLEGMSWWILHNPEQFQQHAPSVEIALRLLKVPLEQK